VIAALAWREDDDLRWTTLPFARLRYTVADKTWRLLLARPHLRFYAHDPLETSRNVDDLLAEIDRVPIRVFWD